MIFHSISDCVCFIQSLAEQDMCTYIDIYISLYISVLKAFRAYFIYCSYSFVSNTC